MSLEECKKLAEEKREKEKEHQRELRRSRGMVDGEDVRVYLAIDPLLWPRMRWVVLVSAYGELSSKYFKQKKKDSAEKYFEELTQKYGLKEEGK